MMLNEKVVVVTGGAGLIGAAFCRRLAAEGARVVVADLDVTRAEALASEISGAAGAAFPVAINITERESIESAIAQTLERFDRIDAVVNNAYPRTKNWGRRLEEVTYADFCAHTNLHLAGYFLVAQTFAAHFVKAGGGNIINMASIYGSMAPRFEVYEGTPMTMPVEYAAIKAGVIQLTKYFAQYFKKAGVRCNSLAPGGVLDGQPAEFLAAYQRFSGTRGMLAPDDLAGALAFLISDASQYVTGQNLIVDDGFSLG